MIIVDLNQIAFSAISIETSRNKDIDEDFVRHLILNCLRSYKNKFGAKFGELVIACDSFKYWRREVFPYYKIGRKKAREESGLNWEFIFSCMDNIKQELETYFPYKFLKVEGAEADDIISVLVQEADYNEPILIISSDKDFIQLHNVKPFVEQYDPTRKRKVSHNNPDSYLLEHIIRGDKGDGIPNIRSEDNSLAIGERQKTISAKMLNEWLKNGIPSDLQDNWLRNKRLIDLTQIPDDVRIKIKEEMSKKPVGSRNKLFGYFIDKNLKYLMEHIGEF